MNDLISVIIPTWNCKYLPEAIESVKSQTYKNWEIIVIDDGSEEEYYDKFFLPHTKDVSFSLHKMCYTRKEHGGIASALNMGIVQAKGKWIKWLSADDVLMPTALEKLVKKGDESFADMIYSDWYWCDEKLEIEKERIEPEFESKKQFLEQLCKFYVINASATLIKKNCFEKVGLFNEQISLAEDCEMWIRLSQYYNFVKVSEPLLKYRWHSENNTNRRLKDIPENNGKMSELALAYRRLLYEDTNSISNNSKIPLY